MSRQATRAATGKRRRTDAVAERELSLDPAVYRIRRETLVIVADPDDVAIGVYESLGFVRGASTWQIERPPAASRAAP
jgi:hypothetical protein